MKKLLPLALALVALALFSDPSVVPGLAKHAPPDAHCFCKAIQNVGGDAGNSIPNPLLDLGVVATYDTPIGHNCSGDLD